MTQFAGLTADKLRVYLNELPGPARDKLMIALAGEAGAVVEGRGKILAELRAETRRNGDPMIGGADVDTQVFAPIEPFVVDETTDYKVRAVIARSSLARIWLHAARELMAKEIVELDAQLVEEPEKAGEWLARFRKQLVDKAQPLVAEARDRSGLQRIASFFGGMRGAEDFLDVIVAFQHAELLKAFTNDLPLTGRTIADEAIADMRPRLDMVANRLPAAFPFVLAALRVRLQQPFMILRIAMHGVLEPDRLRDSPYSVVVDMLMSDLDRAAIRAERSANGARTADVIAAIKEFGIIARALFTELDLTPESAWGKRIGAARNAIGGVSRNRLQDLGPRIKQLLRPNPADKPAVMPDADEITRIEADIDLLLAVRGYADELAMNALATRGVNEVRSFIESGSGVLLERFRIDQGQARQVRRIQLDAAMRLAARVFGVEYAGLLGKQIELAAQADQRRQARA